MYKCTSLYTSMYMNVTCMHACMYMYVCMYVRTYVCTYIYSAFLCNTLIINTRKHSNKTHKAVAYYSAHYCRLPLRKLSLLFDGDNSSSLTYVTDKLSLLWDQIFLDNTAFAGKSPLNGASAVYTSSVINLISLLWYHQLFTQSMMKN